ncbi:MULTISPECIES: ABC transporter permease [Paenibacillus]|uniref:Sugar ABC transporter permease n=1 Tax=Paenibacillus oceani TaxID=2772510 RepID=A0A927C6X2_9BACL|nr:ABC transporter permease subunit [Paenibacillus oceani]MBD2860485.1 sugar ABC transporter permease [Paenibacillus oceani]MDF2659662.1 binding-protein-dependent transport system inner rane component [Paenibacillus sp.]
MSVMPKAQSGPPKPVDKNSFKHRSLRDLKINKYVYLMLIPVITYYVVFYYVPMYGLQIAFKDFSPGLGMWDSPWVGFQHFESFFNSYYFWRLLRNTLLLSLYELLFAFPASIILALLLNELRSAALKRVVQTVTYMPHFISIVVISGMLVDFLARDGLINNVLAWFGFEPIAFLRESSWFRTIFVSSNIWQNIGWGSIIYLSAMSSIDPSLYEASRVDGASRWKQTLHVTLPGIMPTVVILLILQIGSFMSVGTEKILLLYNSTTYETADVIGTFVYRKGILESDFSYSAAVGLFNAIINFTLLVLANAISRRTSDNKLW